MAEMLQDTIFEEREDHMVSITGGIPTLRTAYFLKPTSDSISGPELNPLSVYLSSDSKPPLKVAFNGWRAPQHKWIEWVDRMWPKYSSVWKEAGILEAVMCSTLRSYKDVDLIIGLAERWSSETNTFVFPWGEATITLEDMMILGGLSVLGASPSLPLETRELIEIEEKLEKSGKGFTEGKVNRAQCSSWLQSFMGSGSEVEHEAFLSLWLSRYIFPGSKYDVIGKHVFPIAIHLARGTRIALAPSVLASIYRDLSFLKGTIVSSLKETMVDDDHLALMLQAPFRFVKVWSWERIPRLQPTPNYLNHGELRLARWHNVKSLKIEDVRSVLDSSGDSFLWRPYAISIDNWVFPRFYKEKAEWVPCDSGLDEGLESFARCLRVCELVGLDCREPYFPNRVAMQFGLDQDLPESTARSMETPGDAWINYSRPIADSKLYVPSRLFESDVTSRYLKWWKSLLMPKIATNIVTKERNPRKSKKLQKVLETTSKRFKADTVHEEEMLDNGDKSGDNRKPIPDSVFHGISYSRKGDGALRGKKCLEKPIDRARQCGDATGNLEMACKCSIQVNHEDELPRKQNGHQEVLGATNEQNEAAVFDEGMLETGDNSEVLGISPANRLLTLRENESLETTNTRRLPSDALSGRSEIASKSSFNANSENEVEDRSSTSSVEANVKSLNLEDRISKLERLVAAIKAKRFN